MHAVQLHHTATSEVKQPKGYLYMYFPDHPSTFYKANYARSYLLIPTIFTFPSPSVKMHQGATNVRGGCGGLALLQTTTRTAGEHEIFLHYTKVHNCLLNPLSSEPSDKQLYQKFHCIRFIYLPDCKNN